MLENITGEEIKSQFKSNKKLRLITFAVGGLLVLVLGYFLYLQFIWSPANEKSKDQYWIGLNYAAKDSTEVALDELRKTKNNYDGKIGGEIAQFAYARQLMNEGEFNKAIDELEGVDVEDTYVRVMAIGLQGDCLSELEKYADAANKYLEAADMSDNDFTTPTYLKKAGLCAEEVNDYEMAATCYQRIKDDYSQFANQNQIERYLARAESQTAK
jgi:predicted negative regulator of RcsB-dependent stress response